MNHTDSTQYMPSLSNAKSRFESKVDNKARRYPLIDMAEMVVGKFHPLRFHPPDLSRKIEGPLLAGYLGTRMQFFVRDSNFINLLEVPENHNMALY